MILKTQIHTTLFLDKSHKACSKVRSCLGTLFLLLKPKIFLKVPPFELVCSSSTQSLSKLPCMETGITQPPKQVHSSPKPRGHMKDKNHSYLFKKFPLWFKVLFKHWKELKLGGRGELFFFNQKFLLYITISVLFIWIWTYIWSVSLCKITQLQESEMRRTGWTPSLVTVSLQDQLNPLHSVIQWADVPSLSDKHC